MWLYGYAKQLDQLAFCAIHLVILSSRLTCTHILVLFSIYVYIVIRAEP